MTTIVTVAGFIPHNSGKTRVAAKLYLALKENVEKVGVVKPLGSHNMWEQHFSLYYSLDNRVLVGGDAIRLARVSGQKPEDIQPVDILLAPPDVTPYLTRIRDYLSTLESLMTQVVLMRVSQCTDESRTYIHLYVEEHVERLPRGLRSIVDELVERLEPKPTRLHRDQLVKLLGEGDLVLAADVCTARLISGKDYAIIESYNDVLFPVPTSLRSKFFVVVAPGKAVIYRGEDVVQAASLLSSIRPGSVRSTEVLNVVKPIAVVDLEFSSSDEEVSEDIRRVASIILDHSQA